MSAEIYKWIKDLAVFYILFTALLHLVPNEKYERYVRFFMGILLIFMLSTPLFTILGKSGELLERFQINYQIETAVREHQEKSNLQKYYLEKGYELQIKEKIMDEMKNIGIQVENADVSIREGSLKVVIYLRENPTQLQERRIADGLQIGCQITEEQYQIKVTEHGMETVGSFVAFGSSDGNTGDACSQHR